MFERSTQASQTTAPLAPLKLSQRDTPKILLLSSNCTTFSWGSGGNQGGGAASPRCARADGLADGWDVAKSTVFFASEDSRFIPGVELLADGGLTLKS